MEPQKNQEQQQKQLSGQVDQDDINKVSGLSESEQEKIERLISRQLEYLNQWEPLINNDPACRYVPLRGRLVCTYGLMWICTTLTIISFILAGKMAPFRLNPMLGPDGDVLVKMGALRTPLIRQGEWWRIAWAPMLHAGWIHLIMNSILWWRLGIIIEPDWGFLRTAFVFMVGGISGNLVSATLDPYSVSVGASGGIFGIMGGCVSYVIEYWHTIPRPKCIFNVVLASLIVGLACGFMPYIDNYAHMGGAVGGILAGLLTISKVEMGTEEPLRKRRLSVSAKAVMSTQLRRASQSSMNRLGSDVTGVRINERSDSSAITRETMTNSCVRRSSEEKLCYSHAALGSFSTNLDHRESDKHEDPLPITSVQVDQQFGATSTFLPNHKKDDLNKNNRDDDEFLLQVMEEKRRVNIHETKSKLDTSSDNMRTRGASCDSSASVSGTSELTKPDHHNPWGNDEMELKSEIPTPFNLDYHKSEDSQTSQELNPTVTAANAYNRDSLIMNDPNYTCTIEDESGRSNENMHQQRSLDRLISDQPLHQRSLSVLSHESTQQPIGLSHEVNQATTNVNNRAEDLNNQNQSVGWTQWFWEIAMQRPRRKQLPHRRLVRRIGLRATEIDIVDDSYDWKSMRSWIVRFVGFAGLVVFWVPFLYFLFVCPDCYTAPGQIINPGRKAEAVAKTSNPPKQRTQRAWQTDASRDFPDVNLLRETTSIVRDDELLYSIHDDDEEVEADLPVPPVDTN